MKPKLVQSTASVLLTLTWLFVAMLQPADAQTVLDANEALENGWISVDATSADSHRQMDVTVDNRTDSPQVIDMSTLGYEPESGKEQRVGLSYAPRFGPGHYLVALGPKKQGKFRFSSRCLDQNRPSPKNGQKYRPLDYPLPQPLVTALRQGASQQQIWSISERDANWKRHPRTRPKGSVSLGAIAPEGLRVPEGFSAGIKDHTGRWVAPSLNVGAKTALKAGRYQLWSKAPARKLIDFQIRPGQKVKITVPFSGLYLDTDDLVLIEKTLVLVDETGQTVGDTFDFGEWYVLLPGRYRGSQKDDGTALGELTLEPNRKRTVKLSR